MIYLRLLKWGIPILLVIIAVAFAADARARAKKADGERLQLVVEKAKLEEQLATTQAERDGARDARAACETSVKDFVAREKQKDDAFVMEQEAMHARELERERQLFDSERQVIDLHRRLEALPEGDRCEAAALETGDWYRAVLLGEVADAP